MFHTLLLSFVKYPTSCTTLHGFTSRFFISFRLILKVTKCIKYRNSSCITVHHTSVQLQVKISLFVIKHHVLRGVCGKRSIAPCIHNLATWWRWVFSLAHRPLQPQGNISPLLTNRIGSWVNLSFWIVARVSVRRFSDELSSGSDCRVWFISLSQMAAAHKSILIPWLSLLTGTVFHFKI